MSGLILGDVSPSSGEPSSTSATPFSSDSDSTGREQGQERRPLRASLLAVGPPQSPREVKAFLDQMQQLSSWVKQPSRPDNGDSNGEVHAVRLFEPSVGPPKSRPVQGSSVAACGKDPRVVALRGMIELISPPRPKIEMVSVTGSAHAAHDCLLGWPPALGPQQGVRDAVEAGATGSGQLLSVGSASHAAGTCRPCFFHWRLKNGCTKGSNCEFCHERYHPREANQKLGMRKRLRYRNLIARLGPLTEDTQEVPVPLA